MSLPNSSFTILLKAAMSICLYYLHILFRINVPTELEMRLCPCRTKIHQMAPLIVAPSHVHDVYSQIVQSLELSPHRRDQLLCDLRVFSTTFLTSARRGCCFAGGRARSPSGRFQSVMLKFWAKKDSCFAGMLMKPWHAIATGRFHGFD